jgi:hypothetical protein
LVWLNFESRFSFQRSSPRRVHLSLDHVRHLKECVLRLPLMYLFFLFCYRFMCQRPTIFKFKSFTSSFFKYDHTIDVPLSKVIHLCSINMRILSKNIKSVNHLLCRNIYDKNIGSVWQGFRFTEFGFISLDSPKNSPIFFLPPDSHPPNWWI